MNSDVLDAWVCWDLENIQHRMPEYQVRVWRDNRVAHNTGVRVIRLERKARHAYRNLCRFAHRKLVGKSVSDKWLMIFCRYMEKITQLNPKRAEQLTQELPSPFYLNQGTTHDSV